MTTWLEHGQSRFWGPYSTMRLVCGVPRKMQGCGGSRSTEGDTIQMSGKQCGRMSHAKIHPWDCNARKFSIGRERPCKTHRLPAPSPRHPNSQPWETEDWVQPSQTTPGLFGHRSPMRTAVLGGRKGGVTFLTSALPDAVLPRRLPVGGSVLRTPLERPRGGPPPDCLGSGRGPVTSCMGPWVPLFPSAHSRAPFLRCKTG